MRRMGSAGTSSRRGRIAHRPGSLAAPRKRGERAAVTTKVVATMKTSSTQECELPGGEVSADSVGRNRCLSRHDGDDAARYGGRGARSARPPARGDVREGRDGGRGRRDRPSPERWAGRDAEWENACTAPRCGDEHRRPPLCRGRGAARRDASPGQDARARDRVSRRRRGDPRAPRGGHPRRRVPALDHRAGCARGHLRLFARPARSPSVSSCSRRSTWSSDCG